MGLNKRNRITVAALLWKSGTNRDSAARPESIDFGKEIKSKEVGFPPRLLEQKTSK
jgi:hypothetical protein